MNVKAEKFISKLRQSFNKKGSIGGRRGKWWMISVSQNYKNHSFLNQWQYQSRDFDVASANLLDNNTFVLIHGLTDADGRGEQDAHKFSTGKVSVLFCSIV